MENRGFTLIELMIVIAIISILVAITIPQFILLRNKGLLDTVLDDQTKAEYVEQYESDPEQTIKF